MMSPPSGHVLPASVTCSVAPWRPAFAAAEARQTEPTSSPCCTGRWKSCATSGAIARASTPRKAWTTAPFAISCAATFFTVLMGIAKPMPMLPPPLSVWICELTPTTSPCGVQERPAGVAVIERGVGLDRVVDRGAVRGDDLPLERAHDSGRDRAVLAERVADRDDGVADVHQVRVAELQRRQRARLGLDLEHRDVGARVAADDRRGQPLVVGEADVHARGALDDVVVRDDVTGLVDHEAGAERLLGLALRAAEPERIEERVRRDRDAARRGHLDDARCGPLVDRVDGELPAGRREGRVAAARGAVAREHLADRGRGRREAAGRERDPDGDSRSGRPGDDERTGPGDDRAKGACNHPSVLAGPRFNRGYGALSAR